MQPHKWQIRLWGKVTENKQYDTIYKLHSGQRFFVACRSRYAENKTWRELSGRWQLVHRVWRSSSDNLIFLWIVLKSLWKHYQIWKLNLCQLSNKCHVHIYLGPQAEIWFRAIIFKLLFSYSPYEFWKSTSICPFTNF